MDFKKIEKKWQQVWEKQDLYRAKDPNDQMINDQMTKSKLYVLVEFPYPSGSGLHVGHAFTMTGADVYARKKRMEGHNVLFPMGWDAFGLPTENYAIKTGIHPKIVTKKNTDNFRRQMKRMAFSFDWSREINTTDPHYYQWTQWIFIQLFKHGLAYKKKMPINWCPSCKIGLANEEVVNGKCERCGTPVTAKELDQWLLRITAYADRLADELDLVDFPLSVKAAQRNWIGRSEGAKIKFPIADSSASSPHQSPPTLRGALASAAEAPNYLEVFTTRPDTLWGATFMVIAPEHWLVEEILNPKSEIRNKFKIPMTKIQKIKKYVNQSRKKSELERTELEKDKTGVFTGLYAINPATGQKIPIWISDFVLASYGTGAIMAVPAHDERDYAFAKKYHLPIVPVIEPREAKGKLNSDLLTDFSLEQLKRAAKRFYQTVLAQEEIYSPVLQKEVKFTWQGWNHLFTKARSRMEFISRLCALPKIPFVLTQKAKLLGQTTRKQKSQLIRYWALGAVVDGVAVKVVLRQKGKGPVHFWSLVWQGERKKAAISRLYPRIRANSLAPGSLVNNYITFAKALSRWEGEKKNQEPNQVYEGEGVLINSGPFSLMDSVKARKAIIDWLERNNLGQRAVSYHLRDWIFSRQHYWGEPIPMVYCSACAKKGITWWDTQEGQKSKRKSQKLFKNFKLQIENVKSSLVGWFPIPEDQLPLELPDVEHYQPTGTGESPLATIKDWVETKCPHCGGPARRETDTMPNWAGSSWYFLRYIDPQNNNQLGEPKKLDYWLPVDVYFGGAEHTTLHLLYSRFWHKFLNDIGVVPGKEPYQKRVTHGIVLGPDGQKMSKSRGNVINPDEVWQQYGVDALRTYLMFMGPYEGTTAWNDKALAGVARFLRRFEKFIKQKAKNTPGVAEGLSRSEESPKSLLVALNKLIKKVGDDIDHFSFNTAVAAMMEFLNQAEKEKWPMTNDQMKKLIQLLAPFAPYLAEELWSQLGGEGSVHQTTWPQVEPQFLVDAEVEIVIQVNGKLRGTIRVAADEAADQSRLESLARRQPRVARALQGKQIKRIIFLPQKLINFVV